MRIEDNILITKDGYENLTTAVKDVAEMEKLRFRKSGWHLIPIQSARVPTSPPAESSDACRPTCADDEASSYLMDTQ